MDKEETDISRMSNSGLDIILHKRSENSKARFSILIPSWNNLPYLKLCIDSIRKHSALQHQIIVHINEGIDGTLDWVQSQSDIDYSYSITNVGVCYALNSCRSLVDTDYILYMNDDMYACPGWDTHLDEAVKSIGHKFFFISATAIEPRPQSACAIGGDFGQNINGFQEERLLKQFESLPFEDWMGSTWPPNVVHKDLWDLVGGYSTEFSPGMYSDPDFSMKLWQAGVRYFKGVAASRVYHFGSVSVKRIKKNKGYYAFIQKWGMTSSTFTKLFLKRGERFTGISQDPVIPATIRMKNVLKQIAAISKRD